MSLSFASEMKPPTIIALVTWLIIQPQAIADSPAPPYPWVITSAGGKYLFKMVPAKQREEDGESVVEREAFGVAFKITEDGKFEEIWQTNGWYTFGGFLSEDGRYFIRFGPWASDKKKHTDLAIAFYDQGALLMEYQVRELIKQPDMLEYSVSHYEWRPAIQTEPDGFQDGIFHLVMIDKTTYDFDYKTGKIISSGRDEEAKGFQTIFGEEQVELEKEGKELFDANMFKDDFSRHFEVADIEVSRGIHICPPIEWPAWSAELTPKIKFDYPVHVRAMFPIEDDKRVEVSLTPLQIISAIEKVSRHPFIENLFKNGNATGLRMRILGDRLHWDTPGLIEFIEKLSGRRPKEDELSHWAYFIIDAEDPRYIPIYLNTLTGDIITTDQSQWPNEPILFDATGKQKNANKLFQQESGSPENQGHTPNTKFD